jgi:hypothetical protein
MNDDEEEILFQCEGCGKEFPADPDTMIEAGFGPIFTTESKDEDTQAEFSLEDLAQMDEDELAEIGLNPDTREALLRGEDVMVGGICLCRDCQRKVREQLG